MKFQLNDCGYSRQAAYYLHNKATVPNKTDGN